MFTIDDDNFYEQIGQEIEKEQKENEEAWKEFKQRHPAQARILEYAELGKKEVLEEGSHQLKLELV